MAWIPSTVVRPERGRYGEAGMRAFWNSGLRRALWLWLCAVCLGILGMGAAAEFGESGTVAWQRIVLLVVVALLNLQAISESISPMAPSGS